VYKVDAEHKKVSTLVPKTLTELGFLERFDVQEWIAGSPEILDEELLVIAKELELPSRIRMDLLAVDKKANLVIIELKRDASGSAVDWQAITYASYCSTFTTEQIFTFHAEYLQSSVEEAQSRIEQFIDEEPSGLNQGQSQRIFLVAREFHSDVASAGLWLRDFGVDITCIRLRAYEDSDGDLSINPEIIIPLPEARDYIEGTLDLRAHRRKPHRQDSKEAEVRFASADCHLGST
jgi:hypothetical protein